MQVRSHLTKHQNEGLAIAWLIMHHAGSWCYCADNTSSWAREIADDIKQRLKGGVALGKWGFHVQYTLSHFCTFALQLTFKAGLGSHLLRSSSAAVPCR